MTNKQTPEELHLDDVEVAPRPEKPKLGGKAWRDVLLYGLLRIVLFIVLTVVIHSIVILV